MPFKEKKGQLNCALLTQVENRLQVIAYFPPRAPLQRTYPCIYSPYACHVHIYPLAAYYINRCCENIFDNRSRRVALINVRQLKLPDFPVKRII